MGMAWPVLFVLGLIVPVLILGLTCVLVVRWARELARLGGTDHPTWHYLVGHVILVGFLDGAFGPFLGFFGGPVILLWPLVLGSPSMVVVPIYLYLRLRGVKHSAAPRAVSPRPLPPGRRRWGLASFFVVSGTLVPWATGLGVKIYLDAQARPTLPVADFLQPSGIPVLLALTMVMWAFPFLILASAVVVPWRIGFGSDAVGRESTLPIWLAYLAGVAATVLVFRDVFWEFDAMMLLVPVGLMLIPPMALGYAAGWWLLRRRRRSLPRAGPVVGDPATPVAS